MITCLFLGSLLLSVGAVEITINSTVSCAEEYTVNTDGEFTLHGTGESSAADCSFMFKAGAVSEGTCQPGLCYMFNTYAQFENEHVTLSVEADTDVMTYSSKREVTHGPICMENQASLKVLLSQGKDYVYDAKKPGYSFRLSVFHHCGEKGQVKNMKFEDVVADAKGYHTVEEMEKNTRQQFISGILLGFGLACCFLIVLLIAYCYTRNSPNRGASRSVGMPKVGGFKKKMTPNKAGANEVEMGVGYKATDPDKKPEAEALLTSGGAKPADKDDDDDDDVEETKNRPETDHVDTEEEKQEKPVEIDSKQNDEKPDNHVDHFSSDNNDRVETVNETNDN